jgi:hypothetical protein
MLLPVIFTDACFNQCDFKLDGATGWQSTEPPVRKVIEAFPDGAIFKKLRGFEVEFGLN